MQTKEFNDIDISISDKLKFVKNNLIIINTELERLTNEISLNHEKLLLVIENNYDNIALCSKKTGDEIINDLSLERGELLKKLKTFNLSSLLSKKYK